MSTLCWRPKAIMICEGKRRETLKMLWTAINCETFLSPSISEYGVLSWNGWKHRSGRTTELTKWLCVDGWKHTCCFNTMLRNSWLAFWDPDAVSWLANTSSGLTWDIWDIKQCLEHWLFFRYSVSEIKIDKGRCSSFTSIDFDAVSRVSLWSWSWWLQEVRAVPKEGGAKMMGYTHCRWEPGVGNDDRVPFPCQWQLLQWKLPQRQLLQWQLLQWQLLQSQSQVIIFGTDDRVPFPWLGFRVRV